MTLDTTHQTFIGALRMAAMLLDREGGPTPEQCRIVRTMLLDLASATEKGHVILT